MSLTKRSLLTLITFVVICTALLYVPSFHLDGGLTRFSAVETRASSNGAGDDKDQKHNKDGQDDLFCAVLSPLSGTYIDLSQLSSTPNKPQDDDRGRKDSSKTRWLIRGWDYNTNFTLGICSSPVTEQEESQLSNYTGGFYRDPEDAKKLVSIGDFGTKPILMGNKKLTLKYENGSTCPNGKDRKSTLLYFVCDKDIATKAQITYIGNLHGCSYFFEVRSVYACPTSNKSKEVNILGIFVSILAVFFLVEYGGRRWLYGKMKSHFNSTPPVTHQNSADSRNFHPRWEFIEREPTWKAVLKRFGRLFTGFLLRPRKLSRSIAGNGPIRLTSAGSRSQESFIRDMEQQNDIIDSLDVATNESSSTNGSNSRGMNIV